MNREWRGASFLGAVSLSVLAVALPASLVASVPDVGRSDAWVLTLLVMVWAGVRLTVLAMRGEAHLFDLFFCLFTYIFMGMAPTAAIRADLIPATTPGMDPSLDLPAAIIIVVGVASYEVGRLVAMPRERRWAVAEPPQPGGRLVGRPVRWRRPSPVHPTRTAVLAAVGILLSVYYVSQVGFAFVELSREAGAARREAAWTDPAVRATVMAVALFPTLIALGALLQLRVRLRAELRRPLLMAVGVCVLLIFSVVSPTSSARYTFGTVAFALAVYAGALATPARVRATMIGTLLGLLFVFPLADAFRRSGQSQDTRTSFFEEYLANPDYDSFWQIANAYAYVQEGLVEPGRQFLGSALFWVPRSIWGGKPTDTGILLADYRGYSFGNLSAPLWAEALVNGGVIAVPLTLAAFGYAARRLDVRIAPAFVTGGLWLIVGAVFPVYSMILLRGSLLQATGALAVSVACLVFVRQRPGGRSPAPHEPEPGREDARSGADPQPSYSDTN